MHWREGDGLDVDEPCQLASHDVDMTTGIQRLQVDSQRTTVGYLSHSNSAHPKAAAFDEAKHAQQRSFARGEMDFEAHAHQPFSSIWTFELFGGTSGQTFSRGSIRTWQRIGPGVSSSRRIAPSTSDR